MLGLSWTELLVVGIVALIFIGPKDLPVVMGRIGKFVGQVQRMGRDFQREINKTTGLDEVRNLRNTITDPLKKTAEEIRKEFNAIGKDGQQSPTGVLKPTDPKVESVADAIKEKAGMAPAKSATELAGEYGFKPQAAKPVPNSRTAPPSFADTETAKAAKKTARPKAAAGESAGPVKAARPKAASVKAATEPTAEAAPAKPARKPRAKPRAAEPASAAPLPTEPPAQEAALPAPVAPSAPKKPRAPRKKPAETAEKS